MLLHGFLLLPLPPLLLKVSRRLPVPLHQSHIA